MKLPRELDLDGDFPPVGYAAWREKAEADLKGAPFEKKLVGRTADGIALQPLSTAEDWDGEGDPGGFPGGSPFTRGTTPLGRTPGGWDIRQAVSQPDPATAGAAALSDLRGGADSVELRLDAAARAGLDADDLAAAGLVGRDGVAVSSPGDLRAALAEAVATGAFVGLDAGGAFLPAAALLATLLTEQTDGAGAGGPRGAFNADPLGALLRDGALPVPLDVALAEMADLAVWTARELPGVTAVRVSTGVHHDAGSSAAQDMAFSLATAVAYLRALTDAGLGVDEAAAQIAFHETLGCRFYQSIAKLRALRALWARVLEACGAGPEAAAGARMVVETSRRVITERAPWVNLLRSTAVCFAGACGGADAVITLPMDAAFGPGDETSRRLARETQVILRDECRLGAVLDPAGGSWTVEVHTAELAEHAWALFQRIEAEGGMARAATGGLVAELIAATEQVVERNLATRKAAITGVSTHPDVFEDDVQHPEVRHAAVRGATIKRLADWRRGRADADPAAGLRAAAAAGADGGALAAAAVAAAGAGATIGELTAALAGSRGRAAGARVEPLPIRTYAAAYERLRDAADVWTAAHGGERPKVFLARLGAPAEYLARATWAQDFFEAGGFAPITAGGDLEAQVAACAASGAAVAAICSSDARYEDGVAEAAPKLRAAGARTIVLAGRPGDAEERYRAAGVDRFIFVKCDVLATLRALLNEEGVL